MESNIYHYSKAYKNFGYGYDDDLPPLVEPSDKKPFTDQKRDYLKILYDPDSGTILGKTIIGWIKTVTFFIIFYICLLAFCIALMLIFLEATINEDVPKLTGPNSLLRLRPGLSMRPQYDYLTTMIRYRTSDAQTIMLQVQNIRALLETYEDANLRNAVDGLANCDFEYGRATADLNKACKFDLRHLQDCQKQKNYGYDRMQPCVVLKMNRVFGWLPDILNKNMSEHPLVECVGQNPGDIDNFGPIEYYPSVTIGNKTYGFFHHMYFPYLVQPEYRSPLVMVQFRKPKVFIIIMVRCHLVNIIDPGEPVNFELIID